ncbi:MAG: hydantoinase B/oxoprolinase family protein [Burkholderiales bacterium]|nr:hydantoinase B/oxoprolinase family protein [Burkholderiales bacterium]
MDSHGRHAINIQVAWNRLISVVEEQAAALIRASFSPAVREAGDLGAGVFDTRGRMLAQAITGTAGHVNSMAAAVPHFLHAIPTGKMHPGDAYITNDPWMASGHLHDITIVTPAFRGGRLVGMFAATIHLIDVGGRGLTADGRHVLEEGIGIPIMPLVRSGEINADLMKIIIANTREPLLVRGDLLAVIAAGNEGIRRLLSLMEELGLDDLDALGEHIIRNSRDAMSAGIAKLRPGTYQATTTIDGYDREVTFAASVTVGTDRVDIDFAGTSPASSYGINVVLNYTKAYAHYAVKCLVAPHLPNNHGSLEPIGVSAPEGCILNVQRPSPVAARHVMGHAVPDLVIGCLHQAMPDGSIAESSMMWNPYFRGTRGFDGELRDWDAFFFNSGGMGALADRDGLSGTAFPAGVKSIPVESFEASAPMLVLRKEFRPDSGGAGKHRGGLGQIVEYRDLRGDHPVSFSALFDRVFNPSSGRDGGVAGAPGVVRLGSGARLRSKGFQDIPAGDTLVLELPGGGGYGDPFERPVRDVAADVRRGLISVAAAQEQYGVAVDDAGAPDIAATELLRQNRVRSAS